MLRRVFAITTSWADLILKVVFFCDEWLHLMKIINKTNLYLHFMELGMLKGSEYTKRVNVKRFKWSKNNLILCRAAFNWCISCSFLRVELKFFKDKKTDLHYFFSSSNCIYVKINCRWMDFSNYYVNKQKATLHPSAARPFPLRKQGGNPERAIRALHSWIRHP